MARPVTTTEGAELGRQAAKSKATQDKIINAVIALIREGGFAAASSTRIARKAGVSWGAVQHHFGGKHEILEQVLARSHEKFDETMAGEEFTRGPLEKRVERFINAAWEHYRGDEYMATLEILLASRADAGGGAGIKLNHHSHLALWRRIFFDCALNDRAMQEAIYTVHCMLTGYVIEQVLEPEFFDVKRYLVRLRRILLGMLGEA
jgi:AcrR family transcriptional regulator